MAMEADQVLALPATARATEADWDAMPDMDWFPYTFYEEVIFVLPTTAPLRRVSASGEHIDECGMPLRKPEYRKGLARRGISKVYAREEWN